MINISDSAQTYFRHLLKTQGGDAVGIRVSAVHPGTPRADARLEFCENGDLLGDEWSLECEGFTLYVDAPSAPFLDGANIDYATEGASSQLTIKAPRIKGEVPKGDASLVERVRWLLESEVNPQLASHKGQVSLEEITSDGVVRLRFGGGCHGRGLAGVPLKRGTQKPLRGPSPGSPPARWPTDHSTGEAPYIAR